MGKLNPPYRNGQARTITFCVTEECNLRCKYCYMTEKNSFRRMSFDVAKKAVDFFLHQPIERETVIWDFIGGEPTLEMELIDAISDYIKQQLFLMGHPWFDDYMFNIGTNGLLYRTDLVQKYLIKNEGHVSISITIDGTKAKHDLMRVRADGSGSYDEVLESVRLWLQQYPGSSTKVTFSSDDLPFLAESIIHLWDIGIDRIPANVVLEDVWKEGDDLLFEKQLKLLADYVIDHRLYFSKSVRFFDPTVGFPLGKMHKDSNFCGSGKMIAVDASGNLFPCVRFLDFCIPHKPPLMSGNIYAGYNQKNRKAFESLSIDLLNDRECKKCPIASGCFSCAGNNYSCASENTIFQRTKFHCAMQKAQVRANEYFWNRFVEVENRISPHEHIRKEYYTSEGWVPDGAKFLYIIIDEGCTPVCNYRKNTQGFSMSTFALEKGLQYAEQEHMIPVFIGNPYAQLSRIAKKKLHVVISDSFVQDVLDNPICEFIPVYNASNLQSPIRSNSCILSINRERLDQIAESIKKLYNYSSRINLKVTDLCFWDKQDYLIYHSQLCQIDIPLRQRLNVFSDTSPQNNGGCQAGVTEFTLAPNGKLYHCPGYYYELPNDYICDIEEIDNLRNVDISLHDRSKSPKCQTCHNNHCEQCTLQNALFTGYPNIPAEEYCAIYHIAQGTDAE